MRAEHYAGSENFFRGFRRAVVRPSCGLSAGPSVGPRSRLSERVKAMHAVARKGVGTAGLAVGVALVW
ncbi:hypothetical protein GCM10010350_18430 [Streptomyces galilaeus]|nr:hypothetical protein GCM10010350_18430 [Streptomyces galilaeus]